MKQDETLAPSLKDLIHSPAPYALARTLQNGDVGELEVPTLDETIPEDRFRDYILSGNDALEEHNLPKPHLNDYYLAQEITFETGHDIINVLEAFEDVRPMEVGVYNVTETGFSVDTTPNHLTAPQEQNVVAIEGADPQNYQEYDVHLMAYPLAQRDIPFTDLSLVSRDSHAYIVVTKKGESVFNEDGTPNEEAIEFVTRAGPDNVGILGSSQSSDSSFGNEQNPNDQDKGNDGDVYVASFEESFGDLTVANPFLLQKATILGNITDIEREVSDFRDYINGQDINYELFNRNSNTYAGDVYELLTGKEPDNSHSGLFGRRTPALDNDLVDYEQTNYANDF